jgi:hypothetical protein
MALGRYAPAEARAAVAPLESMNEERLVELLQAGEE